MKEYYLNSNTDICVDVKTVLHSNKTAKTGRDYQGVLTRDNDDHYTFIETIPPATGKRNPQVFNGKFVTITRRSDGTYHPNFKPLNIGANFNVKAYALCVYLELNRALKGLVEEKKSGM